VEIELELALPVGVETTENQAQRRPALQLGGHLLDRQQVRERVLARRSRSAGLMNEAPLLEIAQVLLGHRGIEAADVANAVWTAGR
jgi:hypothetical protein